ncbi:MAG TPA: hypothetical protein VN844_02425 [Pyrinomonadaceae bacterium]|nr:hypothetical protein [Pyrinomonadaceae bacterium]
MKRRQISFALFLVTLLAFTAPFGRAQNPAQRISPPRNWGLAFTRYSEFRENADSLPVKVTSIRGGKLSPDEKFKIEVSALLNSSRKAVTSTEFTWYLFDNTDLDKVVESGKTPLTEVALSPNATQSVQVLVLYVEDIPYLRDKNPHGTFLLEVAVTKVTYDDGSTWEAAGAPGKFDHSKVR